MTRFSWRRLVLAVARMVFEWSLVHGFAMMLIDGRLDGVLGSGDGRRDVMALLVDIMHNEKTTLS